MTSTHTLPRPPLGSTKRPARSISNGRTTQGTTWQVRRAKGAPSRATRRLRRRKASAHGMTRLMTHFDASPGRRLAGPFPADDARLDRVRAAGSPCRTPPTPPDVRVRKANAIGAERCALNRLNRPSRQLRHRPERPARPRPQAGISAALVRAATPADLRSRAGAHSAARLPRAPRGDRASAAIPARALPRRARTPQRVAARRRAEAAGSSDVPGEQGVESVRLLARHEPAGRATARLPRSRSIAEAGDAHHARSPPARFHGHDTVRGRQGSCSSSHVLWD